MAREAVISSILGKLVDFALQSIACQFGYLIHHKKNIAELGNQVDELKRLRTGVQDSIEVATRKGGVIRDDVEVWTAQVEEVYLAATTFLENDVNMNKRWFNGWCPNLITLYRLGKESKKRKREVTELQQKGRPFCKVLITTRRREVCNSPAMGMGNQVPRLISLETFVAPVAANIGEGFLSESLVEEGASGMKNMVPKLLYFTKTLNCRDIRGNLEIPNTAPFLPDGNELMLVHDKIGTTYQFKAAKKASGRRSLTRDWHAFARSKGLRVRETLRIYWLGNGNEYEVQVGLQLFGRCLVWETL